MVVGVTVGVWVGVSVGGAVGVSVGTSLSSAGPPGSTTLPLAVRSASPKPPSVMLKVTMVSPPDSAVGRVYQW